MGLFQKQARQKSYSYVTKPDGSYGSRKVGPSSEPNQNSYQRSFTEQNPLVYSSIQKVSLLSSSSDSANIIDRNGSRNPTWGGDENVDEKATSYISNVRKRLLGQC
ncbi:hypothetical protein PTKIN_Ptkin14bG0128000 [Pterospermum kingtungense]